MFKLLILQRLPNLSDERLQYQVSELMALGIELKSGQIIDATVVPVPIQRNGREDNALITQDAAPINWGKTPATLDEERRAESLRLQESHQPRQGHPARHRRDLHYGQRQGSQSVRLTFVFQR